jgi:predicted AlkP superfamily phosphohydrolase/phosphomutase
MDTLVIGIDGGEWSVIEPLIADGSLPNLSELINSGVHGDLESITPPVSPPAWNSIQTGTNPGKHGIFDFTTFGSDYGRRSVNASDRRTVPFWRVMNDNGVDTGLFKIPFAYPPGDVEGFLVSGFPTPETVDDYTTPKELSDTIGSPARLFEDWNYQDRGQYERFKNNLVSVAERQSRILQDLLDDHDPNFLMTVYDRSDRVQHFFWKYVDETHPRYEHDPALSDAFEEYYEAVDRGIGQLLDRAGPETNVIVLSDHGFGPLTDDIFIEEWLENSGFLAREDPESANERVRQTIATVVSSAWDVARRLNLDSQVRSIIPSSWFQRGSELQDESKRAIEWDETEVFFSTVSGQSLFINLEGRFDQGTVSRSKYDAVVEEVSSSLRNMTHPDTGERLVRDIVRTDEAFEGDAVAEGPDLIVETLPEYTLKGGRSETLVAPSMQNANDRSGDHRRNGIIIASGPAFTTGNVDSASVLDIAPTLLYLCRCPVPGTIDGDVLTEIFTDEARANREITRTEEYQQDSTAGRRWNKQEEAELEERLSSMGYMD